MKHSILMICALTVALATTASAAPEMLDGGKMSIGLQSSERTNINFGVNIADLTKLQVGVGVRNVTPEQTDPAVSPDSETEWGLDFGLARYLGGLSTERFAPFIGGAFGINDEGDNRDIGWAVRGLFGVEAFVIDHLSIAGNIGLSYGQQGKRTSTGGGGDEKLDGRKVLTTSTSAISANLYW